MLKILSRLLRVTVPAVVGFALFAGAAPKAEAQLSIGIGVGGGAPACPYGYYDYAPYRCSPYGYYGPEWFNNGIFFGAGPWYGGPRGFRGNVNRRYDPRFGYRGGYPGAGAAGYYHGGDIHGFRGNQARDGQGHAFGGGRGFNGGGGGGGVRSFSQGGGGGNRGGGQPGGGGGQHGGGGEHGGGGGGNHGGGGHR